MRNSSCWRRFRGHDPFSVDFTHRQQDCMAICGGSCTIWFHCVAKRYASSSFQTNESQARAKETWLRQERCALGTVHLLETTRGPVPATKARTRCGHRATFRRGPRHMVEFWRIQHTFLVFFIESSVHWPLVSMTLGHWGWLWKGAAAGGVVSGRRVQVDRLRCPR